MQDKSKTLPTAFRLTEDTVEKFRVIAQELGANQEQAMAKLIEVYEMEMGKENLPEMRENIETFEGFVHAASRMYLQALEANQNMRAMVRTEYEAQLRSKDRIIEELQERVDQAEAVAENASIRERECINSSDEREREHQEYISELREEIASLEGRILDTRVHAKDKIEEAEQKYIVLSKEYEKLQVSEGEMKAMLSSFVKENERIKAENSRYQEERATQKSKIVELTHKVESVTVELEREKAKAEEAQSRCQNDLEQYKKNLALEHRLELQTRENELKEQHKAEMDELRKELDKYKELYYKKEK